MERYWKGLLLTLLYLSSIVVGQQEDPLNLHVERLHSFKGPFGSGRNAIYYWEHGGSTMITENYVRLTPSQPSKVGWIWNFQPVYFSAWEVVMSFQVSGARLGADGFAFWYAAEPKKDGPAFGYQNPWKGLGVLFDTYDNDGSRNNPYISVIVNDGTKVWDGGRDGGIYATDGCISHFRNTKSSVKITYKDGTVEVSVDVGERGYFQPCTKIAAQLPPGYYFGMTAATGAVHDAHDIYSIDTYNLGPKQPLHMRPPIAQQNQERPIEPPKVPEQVQQPPPVPQQQQQVEQPQHQEQPRDVPPPPQEVPHTPQQEDTESELHQATQDLQQQILKQNEQERDLRSQLELLQRQLQQIQQQPPPQPPQQAAPVEVHGGSSREGDIINLLQQLTAQMNAAREDINVLKQANNAFEATRIAVNDASQKLANLQRDTTNLINNGAKKVDVDPTKIINELAHKVNEIRTFVSAENQKLRGDFFGKVDSADYSNKFRDVHSDLNHIKHSLEAVRNSLTESQGSSWKLWLVIFIAVIPLYVIQLCAKMNKRKPASLRL
eukprot:TRINITY_DN2628_c0_g1_i1.p1 TRINITY_DN2628_c0_g1~~TRINITY_DN2628_c0_g1_i1.p1  ORF type:complete len:627 (+),score=138.34 TRINITY_DN2628_c0_g1_i1:236-1882(+)